MMIGVYGFVDAAKVMVGKQLAISEESGIEYAKKLTQITIISAFIISIVYVHFLFCTEEISKAIIGFFRYKSKRWAVNLTKEMEE